MAKNKSLLLGIVSLLTGIIFLYFSLLDPASENKRASKNLQDLERKAKINLDSISFQFNHTTREGFVQYLAQRYSDFYNQNGISFFIYENDSLQYWSESRVAVENYMLNVCLESRLVKLKNGYYDVVRHVGNAYSKIQLYALILIKSNYPYQNLFLKNEYNAALGLSDSTRFIEGNAVEEGRPVIGNNGQKVFSIIPGSTLRNPEYSQLSFLFFLIFTFYVLFFLLRFKRVQGWKRVAIIFATLIAINLISWWWIVQMGSPSFGSFYYASAGDLSVLIYLIYGGLTLLFFLMSLRSFFRSRGEPASSFVAAVFGVFFIFCAGIAINYCLGKLFRQAYLSYNLSEALFSSTLPVYLCYGAVLIFMGCIFLLIECTLAVWRRPSLLHFGIVITGMIISILLHHLLGYFDVLTTIWPGLFLLLVYFSMRLCGGNRFLYGILICLVISLLEAYLTIDRKNIVDADLRTDMAKNLASPRDEIAENLFGRIQKEINHDPALTKMMAARERNALEDEQYILRKYFGGYWERYHISICLFDSTCIPVIPHIQQYYNNNTWFDELILNKLKATHCKGLFFDQQLKDGTFYLYKAEVFSVGKPYKLYVVIESKKQPDYQGFPELLLNLSQPLTHVDFSYAVYRNGALRNHQGRFDYPLPYTFRDGTQDTWEFREGGYSHLCYIPDSYTRVIVSKNYSYYEDLFSTVGFIFLVASTLFLLFSLFHNFFFLGAGSLAVRMQHFAAIGTFVLFIPVALSTIVLVRNQSERGNTDIILEKSGVIGTYLEMKLWEVDTLLPHSRDYISYLLAQASAVFKNDITLFLSDGEYYAGSLPRLFDEGIISKKLNMTEYSKVISRRLDHREVIRENIGNLKFYSSYRLIKNRGAKSLGVMNVPWFSRERELEARLSGYLGALLNIYLFAFMVVSIAIALLVNWITRPLRVLQEQFLQVQLKPEDYSIRYDRNDEIGMLISSYNKMLIQLRESAARLAEREREGAWKEMAQQVAHEIKNPLTPMKLSIQHLQRIMEIKPEEVQGQLKKLSPVLLEQIDTLSKIASEFSNFWQMPSPEFRDLEINAFISSIIPLYSSQGSARVVFQDFQEVINVMADNNQLIRVMNNLINNALQSIPQNREGVINIKCKKLPGIVEISVEDNGSGVDEEDGKKIFQPHFSTKSYGTGLGLAMCKKIIQQHGGEIRFISELGKGTCFIFSLPLKQK